MNAWIYMEEYKHCSCTQIERKKSDLVGYCRRHGNDRKFVVRLPARGLTDTDFGFIEA